MQAACVTDRVRRVCADIQTVLCNGAVGDTRVKRSNTQQSQLFEL
jgi:hypothetical protein